MHEPLMYSLGSCSGILPYNTPVYASASMKKKKGFKVRLDTGLRRDNGSRVDRENKQSKIS